MGKALTDLTRVNRIGWMMAESSPPFFMRHRRCSFNLSNLQPLNLRVSICSNPNHYAFMVFGKTEIPYFRISTALFKLDNVTNLLLPCHNASLQARQWTDLTYVYSVISKSCPSWVTEAINSSQKEANITFYACAKCEISEFGRSYEYLYVC